VYDIEQETMVSHLRFGLRNLAANPGFAAVAILTLALGIGANTAIFTAANSLLLRPPPFFDPGRLVEVFCAPRNQGPDGAGMSYARLKLLQEQSRSFSSVVGFVNETFNLSGKGDAEELSAARVSWNFFDALGVRPVAGRSFDVPDDQPGGKAAVLISHATATRLFGRANDAVGQSLTLDSQDYTVIGVLPTGFVFAPAGAAIDIWAPRVFDLNIATPQQINGGAGFLTVIARLAPGSTVGQAQAELDILDRWFQRENPGRPDSDPGRTFLAADLQQQLVANIRPALLLLVGAVALVLLIACANVASLLLSRAVGRRKEIAVRAALGASAPMLLRQLLTESVLLAALSGALGILLAEWATQALSAITRSTHPEMAEVRMDLWALAFTIGISLASGILFGLAPALELSKPDLNMVLRDEGRGSSGGRRRNRARNLLVVAQVALSTVLLVGSGLLIRSFVRLRATNPGFDPNNVVTMRIELAPTKYGTRPQMIAFYNEALRQLRALPGVEAMAISSALPLTTTRMTPMLPEGQPAVPLGQRPVLNIETISPDYARVLRVPLLRGRTFTDHDDASSPPVAIVNQAFARRFWPNENPIGKHIVIGRMPRAAEVVGVFGDLKNSTLAAEPNPEVMLPFPQLPWAALNLSIRAAGDPRNLIPAVRHQIAMIDRGQPLTAVQTLGELVESGSADRRFTMFLLGIFSATALILAMVGIYGVIAYSVSQRAQELGIRIALGAAREDILKLVIGHGLALTLTGTAIGLAGSLALTRVMASLLYRTSATDPFIFTICAVIFITVAIVASYIPARRAMRVDPAMVLH
jgi:putative ABC transport system permease protein